MRVCQANRVVTEPILYEEEIPPPVLFADLRVWSNDKIPHWTWAQKRQDKCAEKNQEPNWGNDSNVTIEKFPPNDDWSTFLQPADESVSCQQTTQHQEDVCVKRRRWCVDKQKWIRQALRHLGAVDERIEEDCHWLVPACAINKHYVLHMKALNFCIYELT